MRPNVDIQRISDTRIRPLEVSDYWIEGATLWDWSHDARFSEMLLKALDQWRDGTGAGRGSGVVPDLVTAFDAVFLTGGRLEDSVLRHELSAGSLPVIFGKEPGYCGERGGFGWLHARGLSGWVVDLGKSQLKISTPGWRETFPRDWSRLVTAGEVPTHQIPVQRRRLREFIALKLGRALAETGKPPRSLVFALPTRLDIEGTPGASNYAGMRGDRALVGDAVGLAGLEGVSIFLLNDAELAAFSALADARQARHARVLVLTLGFGIGAAMIHPRA